MITEIDKMTLNKLKKRLDEAARVVVPRLRKAGQDAMADALVHELFVLRTVAPRNRNLRSYHEGWLFGFAYAAGIVETQVGNGRRIS